MKSLFLVLAMFVSTNVFAATVELGKYRAVFKEDSNVVADFDLKAPNKVNLKINAQGSVINCNGTWSVAGNDFKSDVTCDSAAIPSASVIINIQHVNKDNLRTGVDVPVRIPDLLGDEAAVFNLKKVDQLDIQIPKTTKELT